MKEGNTCYLGCNKQWDLALCEGSEVQRSRLSDPPGGAEPGLRNPHPKLLSVFSLLSRLQPPLFTVLWHWKCAVWSMLRCFLARAFWTAPSSSRGFSPSPSNTCAFGSKDSLSRSGKTGEVQVAKSAAKAAVKQCRSFWWPTTVAGPPVAKMCHPPAPAAAAGLSSARFKF